MDPHFLSFYPYRTTTTSRLWKQIIVHNMTNSSCSYVHLSLQDQASKQKKKKLLLPLDMAKTFVQQNVKRETETERGLPETPLPTIYSSRFSITLNPWL
jgi:hypothetical protein